ncbi:hypothetical protein [Ramlibacter sp. AN1133]|uniref:hypothetical protein n=1 Tax=Ramlibacter sp. AN1133 TaxID=3133429 RepID=UPI0030C48186
MELAATLQVRDGVTFSPTVVATCIAAFFGLMLLVALRATRPLARGKWLALGALTYPLYLLHQAIGLALFKTFGPGQLIFWGVIVMMILAAWLVNTQVENRVAKPMKLWMQLWLTPPVRVWPLARAWVPGSEAVEDLVLAGGFGSRGRIELRFARGHQVRRVIPGRTPAVEVVNRLQ